MTSVGEKWGDLVAERGFAQIPNHLLLINQFIEREHRLSPSELLVLIQLAGTWWKKEDLPFPSVETLALRCGISGRQVQRAIGRLEALNLLKRVKRRSQGIIASNAYDLQPLVSFLTEVAQTFPNEFPRRLRSPTLSPAEPGAPLPIRQSFSQGRSKTVTVTRKRPPPQ